jgi:serine/threonine protein kinase
MDISGYRLETIREDEATRLCRGYALEGAASILVLVPTGRPEAESAARFQHELALAAELDPLWAAKPLALARQGGRAVLVLSDPGGRPLDVAIKHPPAIGDFLRLAIALAASLRQVHARGLIHKDIKPGNILVDTEGAVRLTGFGLASRLPREHQAYVPPQVITGTLAYMAPEQTGRMNRSVDSRSDLYSAGVTLYEVLTGGRPFTASDTLEWIHCHIARRPTPPSERAEAIPAALDTIILKLLSKTGDDRYQTASGLEHDLRRCLSEWEAQGGIQYFELGAFDNPDRLIISERLYGRDAEIRTLSGSVRPGRH